MKRPQTLTNAELRAELLSYGILINSVRANKRKELEEQLKTLRAGGPKEPVDENPSDERLQSDMADIVKNMKKKKLALRAHQVEALDTFWQWHALGRGGILGDEMGLGKTCTTVAHMMRLRKLGYGPFIVFSPLSVVDHWVKEIDRFSCGLLKPLHLDSKDLLHGAYVAEYPTFPKNYVVIAAHTHVERYASKNKASHAFRGHMFDLVVIDEAQRCKNSEGLLHKRVMAMSSRFLLLTGTPIQNSLEELYALLTIVDREKFPLHDEEEWAEEHLKKPEEVKSILSRYFLRRTKELVCQDLPPVNQIIFYHGLCEQQTKLYMDILRVDHTRVSSKQYNSLINLVQQLRKTTMHPWLMNGYEPEPFEEGEHMVEASEKLTVIDRLLKYLLSKGHCVLLFSQYTMFLDIIEDFLILRGLEYSRIDGRMRLEDRCENVQAFNASTPGNGPRIFLLSTRAGGLGLNLTNADTVIFADSDWNPQVDLQAMARCHRIGQTKPVRVIRLTGRYTVEQYLQAKARGKLHLTQAIIGSEEENVSGVAFMKYAQRVTAALDKQRGEAPIDLTDAAIERIVGKTDKSGLWIPMSKEEEERRMEEGDDDLEKIVRVDETDHRDISVQDYMKYMGKEFRVSTQDRDELELQITCSKYSGTRQSGTRVMSDLEKDRELRFERLRELAVERQKKYAEKMERKEKRAAGDEATPPKVRKEEDGEAPALVPLADRNQVAV